jgi:outer membrane protein
MRTQLGRWLAFGGLPLLAALLAAAPAPGEVAAPAPRTLTLQEAARQALAENPRLRAGAAAVTVADAEKRAAFSAVLPRVSISGGLTYNNQEVGFGSGEDRRIILPDTDWNARLTITQPLFAGGRDIYAYRQSKHQVESAAERVRAAEEGLLFSVATDYLAAVEAKALLSVERLNRELAEKRRALAQNLFTAGEVTRLDVLRAESAIQGAERRFVEAEQRFDTARLRLGLSLATDGAALDVTDPGSWLPALPADAALLARAEAASASLAQARLASEVAALEIKKARGAYLPIVGLQGTVVEQKSSFPSDSYNQVSLLAQIPLFTGGETGARVTAARERARQAELELEATRQEVREAVLRALLERRTAVATLELARRELALAEAEHEQTFALYQAQEATSLDLDTAELGLASARRAATSAAVRLTLADLAVRYTVSDLKGTLLPEETK